MSLRKVHLVGAAIGAVAAAFAMGGLGYRPYGGAWLVGGLVIGAVIGAIVAHRSRDTVDPDSELGRLQRGHAAMPYHVDGMRWDDYAPAYRLGLEARESGERVDSLAADDLERRWRAVRGGSRLDFAQAWPAIEHAWRQGRPHDRPPDGAVRRGS